MTYITGAIYPSGDRIRIGAPEEETLNAYQQPKSTNCSTRSSTSSVPADPSNP